jgi:hypothetical protein
VVEDEPVIYGIVRFAVRDVPAAAIKVPRAVDRELRDRIGRASVAIVDSALASPYADVAVQHVLSSGVAERAIARALSGELVEVVAADLIRYEVIERVTEQMLAGGVLDRAIERATATGAPERLAEQMLADGIADQIAARLLSGPELERIVERALESPGMERVVDRIVESRLLDETITRVVDDVVGELPSSEALWGLIDVIASSPAVTAAISQQGMGFADQVAEEVRERSRGIDARLERGAWRLLRRRAREQAPPAPGTT